MDASTSLASARSDCAPLEPPCPSSNTGRTAPSASSRRASWLRANRPDHRRAKELERSESANEGEAAFAKAHALAQRIAHFEIVRESARQSVDCGDLGRGHLVDEAQSNGAAAILREPRDRLPGGADCLACRRGLDHVARGRKFGRVLERCRGPAAVRSARWSCASPEQRSGAALSPELRSAEAPAES